MNIRLGNSCINCDNFKNQFCTEHKTKVETKHTCDDFNMREAIKDESDCVTCSKYMSSQCAHPDKAAPEMLCSQWAPQVLN